MQNYINIQGKTIDFSKQELLDCLVSLISYSNSLRQKGLNLTADMYGDLYDKLDVFYSGLNSERTEKMIKEYFQSRNIVVHELYEYIDKFVVFIGLENNPQKNEFIYEIVKIGDYLMITINK